MTTDPIKSAYRRTWWSLVLSGLISLAVGMVIVWRPMESTAAFALVIAFWAIVNGVVDIVRAFDLQPVFSRWWVLLLTGIVSIGFGIAALYYYPALSLAFVVVWLAWWLLLTGGLAVYLAIEERRLEMPWGWTLTHGLVGIAAGMLALINPPITLGAIMGLIAGFAFVSGAVLLVGAFQLASAKRQIATVGSARF